MPLTVVLWHWLLLLFKQQCQCLAYHPPTVSVQYSAKVMSYPSFLYNLFGRWEVFVPKQSEILYEITISLSSLGEYFSMFLEGYPKTLLFLPAFFFSWQSLHQKCHCGFKLLLYRTCCHRFPVQFLSILQLVIKKGLLSATHTDFSGQ